MPAPGVAHHVLAPVGTACFEVPPQNFRARRFRGERGLFVVELLVVPFLLGLLGLVGVVESGELARLGDFEDELDEAKDGGALESLSSSPVSVS